MSEEEQKKETQMIPISTEISEPFHNFLKDYLAFFGSDMTVDDLCQQMIYEESRRLHSALTEFVKDNTHYVGELPWLKKHREVALTIGDWPSWMDNEKAEEAKTETMKELPVDEETYAKLEARAKEKGVTLEEYVVELSKALAQ